MTDNAALRRWANIYSSVSSGQESALTVPSHGRKSKLWTATFQQKLKHFTDGWIGWNQYIPTIHRKIIWNTGWMSIDMRCSPNNGRQGDMPILHKYWATYGSVFGQNTCCANSLKRKCLHFDEIFITGCTESCQNDNFQCSQWWKFHQNDDIFVSVKVIRVFTLTHYHPLCKIHRRLKHMVNI